MLIWRHMHATHVSTSREATCGGYETVDASADALRRPYVALAQLLNCSSDEIAIVSSATTAWQQVVYGLAWTWRPGDRVLISVAEYGSNAIALLQLAKRTGIKLEIIPETPEGDIDMRALEPMLASGKLPALVTISHVPTSSGRVYDAVAVGVLCRRVGVLYMLDACQSVGQMPVDVQRIGCDFLSATGRKFLRGPRGSGLLFCRRCAMDKFEPALLDNMGASWSGRETYTLQPSAQRFESYELSFAAKVDRVSLARFVQVGLGVAVSECVELGIELIWKRIKQLADLLRSSLQALPRVTVWDHGRQLCGLVSFTVAGLTADQVQQALAAQHINTSVSRTGSSRIDFEQRGLSEVVRASVHYYNTEVELQRVVATIGSLPTGTIPA